MTRIAAVMMALVLVAGCGADGEPVRPAAPIAKAAQ